MPTIRKIFSKSNVIMYVVIVTLIALDLISKSLVQSNITLGEKFEIISNFLNFTYVQNKGAAWGIFSQNNATIFLGVVSALFAVVMLTLNVLVIKGKNILYYISFCLVLGGDIGNMVDRFFLGFVRDFIQISFIDFPVFNIADICLVCGIILFCAWYIIYTIKSEKTQKQNVK